MSRPVEGDGFRLRRAGPEDAAFLAGVAGSEDVEPFMAFVSPRDEEAFREEIERDAGAPREAGRFVIEVEEDGRFRPVGAVAFSTRSDRSRIATLHGLMLHPDERGRGLARAATVAFADHLLADLGFHRIELECYGFNERAIAHFAACGFEREGVRRKAYWRHGAWADGVLFARVAGDEPPTKALI